EAHGIRPLAVENNVDVRLLRCGYLSGLSKKSDHALHAHRKTDTGRWLAAQLGDQTVITTTGTHGILCTRGLVDPLEDRAGVVIEATHQARIDLVRHTYVPQHRAKRIEVLTRLLVEMLSKQRRPRDNLLHIRVLAVQDTQRVAFQTALAVGIQPALVGAEVT